MQIGSANSTLAFAHGGVRLNGCYRLDFAPSNMARNVKAGEAK